MYIEIDVSVIPPVTVLREPDDFTSFKVVVLPADHARVQRASIEGLANERADQPQWREELAKMLDYAEQHGWVDERGVRAHVEWP